MIQPETAEPLDGDERLTPARREAYGQQVLGLTPGTVHEEIPEQVQRVRDTVRQAQDIIDRHRGTPEYAEHDSSEYLGPAWGDLARRERDAILQPPKPDITPASELARGPRNAERSTAALGTLDRLLIVIRREHRTSAAAGIAA